MSAVVTNLGLEVRDLEPADWAKLRSARLRALLDSPAAFVSTYDREVAYQEQQWREWCDRSHWLAVEDQDVVIGLAAVSGPAPDGRHHVESIWVAPSHRRTGVFRSLLRRAVEIGRAARQDSLFLWVIGENEVARLAYTEVGFVPTGEEQPLDHGARVERRWRLDVGP